jgi:hypothetical protein
MLNENQHQLQADSLDLHFGSRTHHQIDTIRARIDNAVNIIFS